MITGEQYTIQLDVVVEKQLGRLARVRYIAPNGAIKRFWIDSEKDERGTNE